jgi:hypothetical protein
MLACVMAWGLLDCCGSVMVRQQVVAATAAAYVWAAELRCWSGGDVRSPYVVMSSSCGCAGQVTGGAAAVCCCSGCRASAQSHEAVALPCTYGVVLAVLHAGERGLLHTCRRQAVACIVSCRTWGRCLFKACCAAACSAGTCPPGLAPKLTLRQVCAAHHVSSEPLESSKAPDGVGRLHAVVSDWHRPQD